MPDRPIDPERPRGGNAFDQRNGFSGQDYDRKHEAAEGRRAADPPLPAHDDHADLPPDNGRRATVDPRTGEVRGSGMGAGGGQPGEDLDQDIGGDGYVLTGGEGTDHRPGSLGPPSTGR